jgi:transcription elongation GreA/GreB family factor
MSRAFVKEDASAVEALPDLPISPHSNYVTAEGLAQIDEALSRLQARLNTAGDDRGERSSIERDLRYWRARRASAELVPRRPEGSEVRFGSTVTIVRDGRRQTWRIVGEDEADPQQGTLPYTAPLARALIGKGVGDEVAIGGGTAEIISVH